MIAYPALALLPALGFVLLYHMSRRRTAALAAGAWACYAAYEYAMKMRLLCSGECNIRVDLLAVYPLLLVLSAVAALRALLRLRGRQP